VGGDSSEDALSQSSEPIGVLQDVGIMVGAVGFGVVSYSLLDAIPIRLFLVGLVISPPLFLGGLVLCVRALLMGNLLGGLETGATPGDKICSKCGTPSVRAQSFCPKCGAAPYPRRRPVRGQGLDALERRASGSLQLN
jgi:hypothetical protein